jgi:hypothetical protein
MAALTDRQRRLIRNRAERKSQDLGVPVRWVKGAIHDAAQAIVDTLDGTVNLTRAEVPPGEGIGLPAILSARIDTATSAYGVTFTNPEKKWIVAFTLEQLFERDK